MNGHGLAVTGMIGTGITASDNYAVLHIGHCVDNCFKFDRILKRVYRNVVFVAIPYNNDTAPDEDYTVYSAFCGSGTYYVKRNGMTYGKYNCSFEDAVRRMICDAVKNDIIEYVKCGKKIIIIEDGGYHYKVIDTLIKEYPQLDGKIAGAVEQSVSGTELAASHKALRYPVFSVARCGYKVKYEPGFAAGRIINAIDMMFYEIGEFSDYRSFIVIGCGCLGKAIALKLKSKLADIRVYDTAKRVMHAAEKDGFKRWDGKFRKSDIVIGAVGKNSFTADMTEAFLNGKSEKLYLISASEKQSEFADVLKLVENCNYDRIGRTKFYKLRKDKTIIIPAEGFPINYGHSTSQALSEEMIDPLYAEMLILAAVLTDKSFSAENKLYMTGCKSEFDSIVCEEDIIKQWTSENGLSEVRG